MAFQAEQKIKADILRSLSTEQLFRLLSDSDMNVLMKTLGLLRNLLSTRPVSNIWFHLSSMQCLASVSVRKMLTIAEKQVHMGGWSGNHLYNPPPTIAVSLSGLPLSMFSVYLSWRITTVVWFADQSASSLQPRALSLRPVSYLKIPFNIIPQTHLSLAYMLMSLWWEMVHERVWEAEPG